MSHRLQVLVALLLGAAIGAGIVSCTQQPSAQATSPAKEPAAAPQWEYKVVKLDAGGPAQKGEEKFSKEFNDLAADGWEFNGSIGVAYAAFRRPKK